MLFATHLAVGHGCAQQRRQFEGARLAAGEQPRMQHGDAAVGQRWLTGDGIADPPWCRRKSPAW